MNVLLIPSGIVVAATIAHFVITRFKKVQASRNQREARRRLGITNNVQYDQIMSLIDPNASKEEILTRLAEIEAQSEQRVRESKFRFVERVNALLAEVVLDAQKEMGIEQKPKGKK